jgi:hypothetical protein
MTTAQHESRLRLDTILPVEVSSARLESLAQSDVGQWIEPAPRRELHDEPATGAMMSFRVTNATSPARLFRVEVRP